MFPQLPRAAILRALIGTGSVEHTIELALQGRISDVGATCSSSSFRHRFHSHSLLGDDFKRAVSSNWEVETEIRNRNSPSVGEILRYLSLFSSVCSWRI